MPLEKPSNAPVLSQFSLKDKVAIVTGGARGIGLEVARGLAEAGASVAITYTTSSFAPSTAAQLAEETGRPVRAYRCDVRDPASIAAALAEVQRDFGGGLDIVVANAGVTAESAALEYSPEQFRDLMAVNLDGAFYTAQAAGKVFEARMREASAGGRAAPRAGSVIFTASVSALLVNTPQKQAAYNASKAGVVQLAKCLAVEWVDFARVNCVSPGFISTDSELLPNAFAQLGVLQGLPQEYRKKWLDMTPAGRFCDPQELKGVYVFLASNASSYVTGANIVVDGGYTLP